MLTEGAGSKKVSKGGALIDDPHRSQLTEDSKLFGLWVFGLSALAKLTEE